MDHPTSTTPSALGENESRFDQHPSADGWTRITVHPATGPRPLVVLWLCFAAAPWFFWLQLPYSRGIAPFFVLVSGIILALYLTRLAKLSGWSAKRQPGGSFDIGPAGIRLRDGTVIPRGSVTRVLYRNALSGQGPSGVFIAARGGATAATAMAGAAQQQRDYQAFVPLAFCLDVEHGGRSVRLAGGMTEATAHAVYVQVADRLGLNDRRSA
ncbi:hypothetical protein ELE36_02585 [Pseudolysobacter antarcticus]|uniref:Uncharacterized protein n=1 Tax=Pseudolysobacter antarcticus TaxID=2511995 RepID=A0A411HFV5_9GAMM|nr:hypothetical protein [Pseudolysobacter antarcticus]QBB69349.1 hypothetical protein ELE36_02585 [Pseudolysobacter antarcticus]